MNQNDERWMTRAALARQMGVSERTVGRWMVAGKVKFRRDERTGRVLVLFRADTVTSGARRGLLG